MRPTTQYFSVAQIHQGYWLDWLYSYVPATDPAQLTRGSIQPQLSPHQITLDAALRLCRDTANIGVSGGIIVLVRIHEATIQKTKRTSNSSPQT